MISRFPKGFILILSMVLSLAIGVSGCGTSKTSQPNSSDSVVSPIENKDPNFSGNTSGMSVVSQEVTLYFPTEDAEGLVPIKRTINVTNEEPNKELTNEVYRQKLITEIFTQLAAPPKDYVNPLPEGTKLMNSSVKDKIVTLNLSKEFKQNFVGGATGEQLCLYSIVNTLTSVPGIEQVEFLLEGELKVAILGELDTSTPITPDESLMINKK